MFLGKKTQSKVKKQAGANAKKQAADKAAADAKKQAADKAAADAKKQAADKAKIKLKKVKKEQTAADEKVQQRKSRRLAHLPVDHEFFSLEQRLALVRKVRKQKKMKMTIQLGDPPPDGGFIDYHVNLNTEFTSKNEKLKFECPLCLCHMMAAHFVYKRRPTKKFRCPDCQSILVYGHPDEKPKGQKRIRQFIFVEDPRHTYDAGIDRKYRHALRNISVPKVMGTAVYTVSMKRGRRQHVRNGWLAKDSVQRGRYWNHVITFTGRPMQRAKDVLRLPQPGNLPGLVLNLDPVRPDLRTFQREKQMVTVSLGLNQAEKQYMKEKHAFLKTVQKSGTVFKTELDILYKDDLFTLVPPTWLNATIIQRYLRVVVESLQPSGHDVYIMPARFWNVLTKAKAGKRSRGFPCNYCKVKVSICFQNLTIQSEIELLISPMLNTVTKL